MTNERLKEIIKAFANWAYENDGEVLDTFVGVTKMTDDEQYELGIDALTDW